MFDRNKPFDIRAFRRKFNRALKQNYFYQSREWNYKNIEPKIIAEEVLTDDMGPLVDYKFMCFGGEVKLLFCELEVAKVDGTHNPNSKRNVYDRNFKLLDITFGRERFDPSKVARPENFLKMVEYAEILSKPFANCRVDFYNINGEVYFGKITFYHGGARQRISHVNRKKYNAPMK